MPHQSAREFLAVADQFQLGELVTEQQHPLTRNLSQYAKEDVRRALAILKKVDADMLAVLDRRIDQIHLLSDAVKATFLAGHRVFLCGCGATGRLSLAIETLWRQLKKDHHGEVVSFMAGGDVALISSIEKFEDFPEYGARQLHDLGFQDGDLLIACSEGGETPFVIGAVEAAATVSANKPFFLYCNPSHQLTRIVARSRRVIENPKIMALDFAVGPMALSGSTRMQASTILMYALGLSLWAVGYDDRYIERHIAAFVSLFKQSDINFLESFIALETDIYQNGEYIFYETDERLGISILTDTTERSPTFSLYPFENQLDAVKHPSLCYLLFENSPDARHAWRTLLFREPRAIEWPELNGEASLARLLGFDFSHNLVTLRRQYLSQPIHRFKIYLQPDAIDFNLRGTVFSFDLRNYPSLLHAHIFIKMILNMYSTIVMGRLGRYERNVMTWVRPSNNKLIDRAIRYTQMLLREKGNDQSYEAIARECFRIKANAPGDLPLVLALVERFNKA